MLEVADLRAPQSFLIFQVGLVGKICDAKNRFVGDGTLVNAEFEKFVFSIMVPFEPDELIVNMFEDNSGIGAAIPGKMKSLVALVYFISEPFLEANRGR
jgi:hypothetical protein